MTKRDEAIYMMDELDKVLLSWEKPDNEYRQPTVKGMRVLARVVRWLLERYLQKVEKPATNDQTRHGDIW